MPADIPRLHSKYNPEAEAARYINSLNLNENTECFILIEPGEGYMIPALREKFPNSKIIALHVNDPEPESILAKNLININPLQIKIIEWRPSMDYYKEEYVKLLSLTVKYLKQFDAEKRTVAAFGERWLRNFFKNLKNINSVILYKETNMPVIITGSGPSLEEAIPIIKNAQKNCLLIASSSSVMALSFYGIKPDFAIATDGGCWALKHLYPLFREQTGNRIGLAVSLCAALPSQCSAIPQLLLNDGSLWQSVIFNGLQLPSVIAPERGTVTASAVELALQLTSGNIYLAGTDLAARDLRTHIKPYEFDNYLTERSNRFAPLYSQSFVRSRLLKEGGSLDIYAEWFKKQYDIWPKRIYNINEKPAREGAEARSFAEKEECFKIIKQKDTDTFYETGINILLKSIKNSKYSEQLKKELEPLLGEDMENYLSSLRSSRLGVRTKGSPARGDLL